MKPFSKQAQELKLGAYQHFKGKLYSVVGVARHEETLEELVIYQAEYGDNEIWARPLARFVETVEVKGKNVPRFKFVD